MDADNIIGGPIPTWDAPLIGRPDEVEWISQALDEESHAVLTSAGPGVGCTRLAAEWVHQNSQNYDWLAWIDASSSVGLSEGLDRLASHLGVSGERGAGLTSQLGEALSKLSSKWAIVVDDGRMQDVSELFDRKGHVVVVARGKGWPIDAEIPISPLSDRGPEDLLSQSSGFAVDRSLRNLAASLGGLPLALKIAGRVLARSGGDADAIESMVESMKRGGSDDREAEEGPAPDVQASSPLEAWLADHMDAGKQSESKADAGGGPGEVIAAVGLAIESLRATRPSAIPLAYSMAMLGSGAIDTAVLAAHIDPIDLDALGSVGLADLDGAQAHMHSAVQKALVSGMPAANRLSTLAGLLPRVGQRLASDGEGRAAPRDLKMADGLAQILTHTPSTIVGGVELLTQLSKVLLERGWATLAKVSAESAVKLAGKDSSAGSVNAAAFEALSDAYLALGETGEAQYQLEEAVRIIETRYGAEDARVSHLNHRRASMLKVLMQEILSAGPGHPIH